MTKTTTATPTIHLQGLGRVRACPVERLQPGQKIAFNQSYGEYEVVSVTPVSPAFMELRTKKTNTGAEFTRRVKKGRLIGVAS